MTNVTLPCLYCGKPLLVTDTTSLYRPNGEPYRVTCGTCYNAYGLPEEKEND